MKSTLKKSLVIATGAGLALATSLSFAKAMTNGPSISNHMSADAVFNGTACSAAKFPAKVAAGAEGIPVQISGDRQAGTCSSLVYKASVGGTPYVCAFSWVPSADGSGEFSVVKGSNCATDPQGQTLVHGN